MSRENIRLRVREILAQRGMDCATLAERMGKSPQYVNNVLNKRKDMSLNALVGIADALGVEFGDLFASSSTPAGEDGFSATVSCRKGVFRASSVDGLQDIVDALSGRQANMLALTRRTLERALRFPSNTDPRFVSETMANLSRCMNPDDWHRYYNGVVKGLLPPGFVPDYGHLKSFMTDAEVEGFERSLA